MNIEVITREGAEETWHNVFDFKETDLCGPKRITFKTTSPCGVVVEVNYVIMNLIGWTVMHTAEPVRARPNVDDTARVILL